MYASVASLAFGVPYEACLEFHPETHEYQPEGKKRRSESKVIVLGICYGRSVPSIAEQLYGKDESMSDEEKTKNAQKVYDSVLNAFPGLRAAMINAQKQARTCGYTETILGRRRHLPDMQLPEFEFKAASGYVNPDIDPLDISTLESKNEIPDRIVQQLTKELKSYKYPGQVYRRIRELKDQNIIVVNNRQRIADASRQTLNCVDIETEILTLDGWKTYDEVKVGDKILSFDVENKVVTSDSVEAVHIYEEDSEVICFNTPTFSSVSTPQHRWVCNESSEYKFKFITSEHIERNRWPDYPILRVWDNNINSQCNWSDDQLKLFGWIMTDGSIRKQWYSIALCQTVRKEKNRHIYQTMLETLDRLKYSYCDKCNDNYYHTIYLHKNDWLYDIFKTYQYSRQLTFEFVSTLDQHQAEILMWSMIEGDGTLGEDHANITFTCSSKEKCDVFQYLAFVAGYATSYYEISPEEYNSHKSSNTIYASVGNAQPIRITQSYFTVSIYRIRRAQIYPHHKSRKIVNKVWCVTTKNGTWIARRDGKVYITGNSIIQGSAADQTKMALLELENNQEWKDIGGRLLVPVHDEIIAEVPMEYYERGGEILSSCMLKAAEFLPFDSKCDVTATLRWYGLEYPCPHTKPNSIDTEIEDEVSWIQWHLIEAEYDLPILPNPDGSKPRGNAARGVNGKVTEEYKQAIQHYISTRRISKDTFIDSLEQEIVYGVENR